MFIPFWVNHEDGVPNTQYSKRQDRFPLIHGKDPWRLGKTTKKESKSSNMVTRPTMKSAYDLPLEDVQRFQTDTTRRGDRKAGRLRTVDPEGPESRQELSSQDIRGNPSERGRMTGL